MQAGDRNFAIACLHPHGENKTAKFKTVKTKAHPRKKFARVGFGYKTQKS